MTRYFQSLGAGHAIEIGGRSFIFEPVEPMGGSWVGVLATDEESAANILASANLEITQEAYDRIKKKVMAVTEPALGPSRTLPRPPPQPIVVDAVRAEDRINFTSAKPVVEQPTKSVVLTTTKLRPPAEPLIDAPPEKKRRAA